MSVETLQDRLPPDVRLKGLTYDPEQGGRWMEWLSREERERHASFGSEKRKREFVLGRAAARGLLGEVLDETPDNVGLHVAEDGAIDVDPDRWHVSIAHSGSYAVAACAPRVVGVDVEKIQPRNPALRRFLFAEGERSLPDRLPYTQNTALLLCWTLKEAVLKARRSGLRTSPKDLHLAVDPTERRADVAVENGEAWQVWYARVAGCWCAVALSPLSSS